MKILGQTLQQQGLQYRRAIANLSSMALRANVNAIKDLATPAQVIAMVKANGYGHGIRSVAGRLADHVFALGVASVDEAIALRAHGIQSKIILMEGVLCRDDLPLVSSLALDLVVHDKAHLEWLAVHRDPIHDVWVKVDIGMGRLGFFPEHIRGVFEQLRTFSHVRGTLRLLGHLSHADSPKHPINHTQISVFSNLVKHLQVPASLCNSAAIASFPQCHYDFIRPGISLYGASPIDEDHAVFSKLKPVMTVKSRLIAIKNYAKGQGIGYGHDFICPQPMRVGVISFGYGDGYPRSVRSGAPVLVNQHLCPLVGRISMDMMTVDLTACGSAAVGDEVVLWGDGLPITEVERFSGISRYELFTNVQNRVKFIWDDI